MVRTVIGMLLLLSFSASADLSPAAAQAPLTPDPQLTTGDFCDRRDDDFEEFRYQERIAICFRDVSWDRKEQVYDSYGIPRRCRQQYTVDHYIPLSIGGSNRVENLWPEHKDIKATRQNLEQQLYLQMKNGLISQQQALRTITHAKQNPPHVVPRDCD